MRRLELLVQEVKDSSDTNDINSYNIWELMRYFNDGQKLLQKIIYTANPSADVFVKQALYEGVTSQTSYALPDDIYAKSSITAMFSVRDGYRQTLKRVEYRETEIVYGYALLNSNFVLTTRPGATATNQVLMNYTYKLPQVSYRLGKIDSIDTGTGIVTISGASLIGDTDFQLRYDNYSIVSKSGTMNASKLELDNYAGLSFTFSGDLTEVEVGDYIVCGEYGTSHSELPDECEPFLMSYVQRRIKDKVSSEGAASENIFTMEERADIEDLFKDNVKDSLYPVASDTYFLGY